jgi:3',5'-cyclic AMP phosphodiesterase CpdA
MRRALAVVALLFAGCGGQPVRKPDPSGSTLRSTWVDPQGDGTLQVGPGERLADRTDLGRRRRPGAVLARVVHLTDAHVRDEESPARATFLDRLGAPFTSTFRPQEALTAQVLGAAVRSADAARPDAVVEGGDLADNNQANELAWGVQALRGGLVRPDSGRPGYDGPQAASDPDSFFYRPDVDAPRLPGLLARAQEPFRSPGLRAPWYPVAGNHDVLVDGEVARTAATAAVAVGDRRLVEPRPGLDVPRAEDLAPAAVDALLAHGLPGRTVRVAPDGDRRELGAAGAIAALRSASGAPGRGKRLDYTFDVGRFVRGIVLDITRRDGGSGGVVAAHELAFLRDALAGAGGRWVIVFTHQPLATAVGAQPALALLATDPHVLAAVAGHTHANRIEPVRTPAGGYWSITTASLADWPQQERLLQVRGTAGGGAVIETWILDTAPDRLADTARSLAFLDAQGGRPSGFAGRREDRNVRLWRDPPSPR